MLIYFISQHKSSFFIRINFPIYIFKLRTRKYEKDYHLPHISQRNGVSFVCERIWLARCSLRVYFLPQAWQWWGVSPVCHITWFIKCSLRVKLFLQISHRCGVSPVCLRTWFTICSFRVNVFEQYWHLQESCHDIPFCYLQSRDLTLVSMDDFQ